LDRDYTDPVHPEPAGYAKVADYMMKGLVSMEGKRINASKEDLEVDQVKMPSQEDLQQDVVFKRPAWTRCDDAYVSRDIKWFGGGRGGGGPSRGRGSGGWARRGRGWWLN
jgi:hypothetical protein